VAAERGGTHRRSEAVWRAWPAARERSGSQISSMTSGSLGRCHDIVMERGRPWRFCSPRRGSNGDARTAWASSHQRGVAPTALQATPSSGGVLRPTRIEGRATGRLSVAAAKMGNTGDPGGADYEHRGGRRRWGTDNRSLGGFL
jgi:hypothetical protein